jgi:predicted Mrr-cat superfamily restriction endonuclease
MINVWCVRADFGTYAKQFVEGGYIAIDYHIARDLQIVKTREELAAIYRTFHPDESSNIVVGQQAGQLARFLLEIKAGDYVITPAADTDWLNYGKVQENPLYYYLPDGDESCPYRHRRHVRWAEKQLKRSEFSIPFQNTIRSSLTVFAVSHQEEFLNAIGQNERPSKFEPQYNYYEAVLKQILQLDAKEFEILVGHLLTAIGFEESKVTGKPGDGGVDAIGVLDVANLAKVKLFVQAKRYKLGSRISASMVRSLRQAIPRDGQGAFITTAEFDKKSSDIALDPNFPRIGLINGLKLVDLLFEHWNDIPNDFQDKLGLKPGLVRS